MNKKVTKAIIPAAGLGTRFLPATKAQPKEMLPIVDKPTIQFIVEEAVQSGIEDILIVTGRNKRAIEDHFDKSIELEKSLEYSLKVELLDIVKDISNMVDIHYIRQKEPRGLGDAIYCARKFIGDEPFAVLLGDIIIHNPEQHGLKQLIEVYNQTNCSIIGVQHVNDDDVSKYGIVKKEFDFETSKLLDIVEKPSKNEAPSNYAVIGRYVFNPSIFNILNNLSPGKGNEVQLTDGIKSLLSYEDIYSINVKGQIYDIGDKFGFLMANIDFALLREDLSHELVNFMLNKLSTFGFQHLEPISSV